MAILKCGLYNIWIQKPWKADEGLNDKNSEYFPQSMPNSCHMEIGLTSRS